MIYLYQATPTLQKQMRQLNSERELLRLVIDSVGDYEFACQVASDDLDLAFVSAGGALPWMANFSAELPAIPAIQRPIDYGDILIEQPSGYVNLATPAGFIPLVDIIFQSGQLYKKQFN
jgi:hypothetical protein